MEVRGAVTVVTGGASGIGRALCERLAAEGAGAVVVADLDEFGAQQVAGSLPDTRALGLVLDVTVESAVRAMVERVEADIGPIDLYCSNAGLIRGFGIGEDADWNISWQVHLMAQVYAARVLMPRMVERGRGHLLLTASAAGLLMETHSAPYSVTKHATVAIAEWLAVTYGDAGIGVSCLCPQWVRTPLLDQAPAEEVLDLGKLIEPAAVADAVIAGLAAGTFLILPHPEVATYEQRRAGDRDRWLAGMRRLRASG